MPGTHLFDELTVLAIAEILVVVSGVTMSPPFRMHDIRAMLYDLPLSVTIRTLWDTRSSSVHIPVYYY